MSIITIDMLNEVFLRINCNIEQAMELKEYTSCYAPNFMFNPRFRAKIWNGKISFFNMKDQTLPIGLLPQFFKFCEEFNYNYQFKFDKLNLYNVISNDELLEFYKVIFKDTEYFPRDYQDESIQKALKNKRGVIVLPTASGKSAVIYCIIRFLLAQDKKILLVVPSINLTEQMFTDFIDYGFKNAEDFCSVLYNKSTKYNENRPILISTWQSIYKRPESFFEKFDAVIEDEAHGGKSTSLQTVLKKCINAEYRIGLTGTLPTNQAELFTIFGYLGPKIYYKKSKELIDRGVLSKIKIANLVLRYSDNAIQSIKDSTYSEQTDFVIQYEPRNDIFKFIINKVDQKHNILILCYKIEHLKNIEKYIKQNFPNKSLYVVYGKTEADEREEIRKLMEKMDGAILLASYGTLSTGVNIKKIHHVVFASSYKSKIKVLQSIGRGLRKHDSKDKLVLWDIVDNLCFTKRTGNIKTNYTYEHWLQRLKFYKEQGFSFLNKEIKI